MVWERSAIIIPGAQKSGTTTLFKMLAKHSQVDRPALKEPQFFALHPDEIENKFSWYEELFSGPKSKTLLDASAFYLSSARAPAMIKRYIADPRILIILRDPAQRAYSGYLHMSTKEPPAERRSFDRILEAVIQATDCGSVAQAEKEVLSRAVARRNVDANYLDEEYHRRFYGEAGAAIQTNIEDPLFIYRYFQQSMYRKQVERYVEVFGPENVKVVFFEHLIAKPDRAMRGILDFLKLTPEAPVLELVHRNKTHPPRSRLQQYLLTFRRNSASMNVLIEGLKAIRLGSIVRAIEQFVRTPPSKPTLSKAQYEQTRALLAEEYAYWGAQDDTLSHLWTY